MGGRQQDSAGGWSLQWAPAQHSSQDCDFPCNNLGQEEVFQMSNQDVSLQICLLAQIIVLPGEQHPQSGDPSMLEEIMPSWI